MWLRMPPDADAQHSKHSYIHNQKIDYHSGKTTFDESPAATQALHPACASSTWTMTFHLCYNSSPQIYKEVNPLFTIQSCRRIRLVLFQAGNPVYSIITTRKSTAGHPFPWLPQHPIETCQVHHIPQQI